MPNEIISTSQIYCHCKENVYGTLEYRISGDGVCVGGWGGGGGGGRLTLVRYWRVRPLERSHILQCNILSIRFAMSCYHYISLRQKLVNITFATFYLIILGNIFLLPFAIELWQNCLSTFCNLLPNDTIFLGK